jgi:glycosyltransferase involved in cell wall biosynthesis
VAKVSVIIPTYNYGKYLGEAIQSVLGQTFADFELIVVDDGSTDNTREVVDSFSDPRIKYIYQENRGLSAAENTGIKASCGEYISILGADDMWPPENLALKVKLLDAHPDIGLVCSDAYVFDNHTGATIGRFWRDKPFHDWVDPQRAAKQPLKEMLIRGCFVAPQTVLVRRQAFTDVGYFDESLLTHDDWDMFVRIIQRYSIEIMDVPLARLRRHGDNMSTNMDKMLLGEAAVLQKAVRSYSLSQEELKLVKARQKTLVPDLINYGRRSLRSGNIAKGREALLDLIKIQPLCIKPYFHLILSIFGYRGILTIRSSKKWLMNHIVWYKTAGEA